MSRSTTKSQSRPVLNLENVLGDVVSKFEFQARESIRKLVHGIFEEEIAELAGTSHRRGRNAVTDFFRAGSDPGSVKVMGQRMAVRKPRVKKGGKEIRLKTYNKLQNWELLTPQILDHMVRGVSTRDYDALLEEISGGLGLSKSSVSRAFIRGSKQALEKLQTRSLKEITLAAVMIDGIHFGPRNVVVAVGIDGSGCKTVLGLKEGNTESASVCTDLLQELIERGLSPEKPFLFVIDGGKGIRRAIKNVFGENFPVQRCYLHKLRNIEEYLPEQAHTEFRRRFKKLRTMERYSDALTEYNTLKNWLSRITSSASDSLEEAGLELLTVIRIGAGPILRRAVMTTNAIESVFSHVRYRSGRVKNWTDSPDKIRRWLAVCLLHAEKKTNRIHGYFECNEFIARVQKQGLQQTTKAA